MIYSRKISYRLFLPSISLLAHSIITPVYAAFDKTTVPDKMIKAQSFAWDDKIPKQLLRVIKPFIPVNHKLLYLVVGDLNRDQFPDILLALKHHQEAVRTQKEINRPLLLLVATAKGQYRLAARNDKVIFCYSCGGTIGDPFVTIQVKNGEFTVSHYGGSAQRWTSDTIFSYNTKKINWFLRQKKIGSFQAGSPDKITWRKKTKKDFGIVPFKQYDYDK